jgi:hypothetical protein
MPDSESQPGSTGGRSALLKDLDSDVEARMPGRQCGPQGPKDMEQDRIDWDKHFATLKVIS